MRKPPQIIVGHSKLTEGFNEPTETVFIVGRGDKSGIRTTDSPALYVQQFGRGYRPRRVRWWNKPLGPYYTVGESLAVAVAFLVIFAIMLAVWAS